MLRAIGLNRRQVKRMVRLESLMISIFGAVLGLGAGTLLAWAASRLIEPHFSAYSMQIPWNQYAGFAAAALIVGVLAAIWPARRAARLNALEAIKTD
jgi:putative ABC transport system permease protein